MVGQYRYIAEKSKLLALFGYNIGKNIGCVSCASVKDRGWLPEGGL